MEHHRKTDASLFREILKVLPLLVIVVLMLVHLSKQDIAQLVMYEYGILKAFTAWLGGHLTFKLGVKEHLMSKEESLVNYLTKVKEDVLRRKEDADLLYEIYSRTKAINNGVYALCVLAWAVCLGFSL